jgi:hypothetical protein
MFGNNKGYAHMMVLSVLMAADKKLANEEARCCT